MTSSTARTIQRRDAAVTAALVGGVLVILGYASGIGLEPQSTVAASLAQPQAPTTTPAPDGETPAPAEPVAEAPAVAAPVGGSGTVSAHVTGPATAASTPSPAPSTQAPPTPPADPAPEPAPVLSCATEAVDGLLGGLPLVSDVTALVQNLLGAPLAAPLVAPQASPSTAAAGATPTGPADEALGACPAAARVPGAGAR